MHIKFLEHGTGSGAGAARYLLGTHDHNGIRRGEVKVLRGDPVLVGKVSDSLLFKNKYTSGVIAFSPTDKQTPAQIEDVLEQFERVAFAGIDKNRLAYSAILHDDHVHIFCARVDLETGKSFNMAPPGWEKSFDPVRDYFNHTHGWARPDDPLRARNLQPGKRALMDTQALRRGLEIEPDTKAIIHEYLEQQIVAGNVRDRASMLAVIEEAGFTINRAGKDYITVVDENNSKFRMKGLIYGADWNVSRTLEIEDSRRSADFGQPDKRSAERARQELEEAIRRRADYNQGRYRSAPEIIAGDAPGHVAAPALVDVVAPVVQPLHIAPGGGVGQRVELVEDQPGGRAGSSEAAADTAPGSGVLQQSGGSKNLQEGVNHDGIRNDIARAIEQIKQRVASASAAITAAIGRCNGALGRYDKELRGVKSTNAGLVKANDRLRSGVDQMIVNNENELHHFKADINLVEFAETLGYIKDESESGRNSVMMRAGKDKIVIATKDGHGVYFNVHDDSDNGSIVDFLQKRQGLNLGQVRKELRPWIGLGSGQVVRRKPPAERPEKPVEIERDQEAVLKEYYRLGDYQIGYLEQVRKLSPDTVKAFLPIIRTDDRNNTCFVHSDSNGDVTGWEVKNKDFTGFSAGSKSLSVHSPDGQSKRLVICESMIDGMSFYQLNGKPGDVYASIAGSMSPEQEKLLEGLCEGFKDIMLAVDKDDAGKKYAEQVRTWRPDAKWLVPTDGKDWNDALKVRAAQAKHERNRGNSQTLG